MKTCPNPECNDTKGNQACKQCYGAGVVNDDGSPLAPSMILSILDDSDSGERASLPSRSDSRESSSPMAVE